MNTKWNYVLSENKYSRLLFRVYPKQTYIHSFDNEPPKTWDKVYKVYYSWAIIKQYKNDYGIIEPESSKRLMYMYCDECSNVVGLHEIIRWVIENQKEYNYPTIGQPAGDWKIDIRKGIREWNNNESYEYYDFQVFDNWDNNGFRFTLDKNQTEDFANWLEQMNERALAKCGCPI